MTKTGYHHFRFGVVLCALVLVFTGCSAFKFQKRIPIAGKSSPEALELLSSIQTNNLSLNTFKGLGEIRIVQNKQLQKYRAAWAGSGKDHFRIQLVGPTGQPVLSVACDGSHYYFLSPDKEDVVKKKVTPDGLQRYIDIPIGTSELLALLCGRSTSPGIATPLVKIEKETAEEVVLALVNPLEGVTDHIYFNMALKGIGKIERRDDRGRMIWWATLEAQKTLDSYRIPTRLTLFSNNDVSVRIDVERLWGNPQVSEEMFIIANP